MVKKPEKKRFACRILLVINGKKKSFKKNIPGTPRDQQVSSERTD